MAAPPDHALSWALTALGGDLAEVVPLREGGAPWLVRTTTGTSGVLRIGYAERPGESARMATEAAALTVAQQLGVAAPRVLAADSTGAAAGVLALLITEAAGSSRIPRTTTAARLQAFGGAVARLAAVPLGPSPELPLRERSLEDWDFAALRAGTASELLLATAEQHVAVRPVPPTPTVLVHGDLWHGNVMWVGEEVSAIIDWDAAGAGPAGIDLGGARCDAALLFDPDAPEHVLAGWEAVAGRAADDVAYWDVAGALGTQPDMAAWIPAIYDQGRTDLTADDLNRRRDAFLRAALDALP